MKIRVNGKDWLKLLTYEEDTANTAKVAISNFQIGSVSQPQIITLTFDNEVITVANSLWKCFSIYVGKILHVFYYKEFGKYYHPDIHVGIPAIMKLHAIDVADGDNGLDVISKTLTELQKILTTITFTIDGDIITGTYKSDGLQTTSITGTEGLFISGVDFPVKRIIGSKFKKYTYVGNLTNNNYVEELFEYRIVDGSSDIIEYIG